jgi:hypothetical protein
VEITVVSLTQILPYKVLEILLPSTSLTSRMIRLAVRKKCTDFSKKLPDSIISVDVQVAPVPDHKVTSRRLTLSQFYSV